MPKDTVAELKRRIMHLDSVNSLLQIALHDLITGVRPDASERVPVSDCGTVYHGQLFRFDSASGGYVIMTREWESPVEHKKLSATSVHYLDFLGRQVWPTEVKILAERLTILRNRLLALETSKSA
jgi:hypothetical protein